MRIRTTIAGSAAASKRGRPVIGGFVKTARQIVSGTFCLDDILLVVRKIGKWPVANGSSLKTLTRVSSQIVGKTDPVACASLTRSQPRHRSVFDLARPPPPLASQRLDIIACAVGKADSSEEHGPVFPQLS